uniref:Uncharacterized protein n=1 Tax=Schistocephalus solidus TaxID=70667 RepID=A0A0X3NJ59_SCHSO
MMSCHHRIAYIFLCVLHILLLIALLFTIIACGSIYLECEKCNAIIPNNFNGCKFNLTDNGKIAPGKIVFLVGVVLSVVALVLILRDVCKCSSIKKWKKPVKKNFKWIFVVLLLTAIMVIASSILEKQFVSLFYPEVVNSNFSDACF